MAQITFFGKPNCINNNKQKTLLKAAGHNVDDRNILTHPWTPAELRSYFGDAPVSEWFNKTAPAVKANIISIETLSESEALEAMCCDRLLIRRPLMAIENERICGFQYDQIDTMVGLTPTPGHEEEAMALQNQYITACPFIGRDENCDQREK